MIFIRIALLIIFIPFQSIAQINYPEKQIRLIVPFPPGGGVDNFARPLAQQLSEQIGQQVIVDNRAGAGGVVGSAIVAKAAPNGYTLLANTDTSVYLTTLVVKNASYDPIKDLTPIISAVITPTVFVVHPSLPIFSMKDLIDFSKASQDPVPYVTAGIGSLHHLTGESLAKATNIKLLHIAYKGGSSAQTDLLGGQVKVGILILSTVIPQIQSGNLRVLATIENHRSKLYSNIPTIAENGVSGFSMPDTGLAIWGPPGISSEIIDRINNEVRKALLNPSLREVLEKSGYETRIISSKEFSTQATQKYSLYQRLIKEVNLSSTD